MSEVSMVVQKFYELAKEAERIDSEVYDEPTEPVFEAVLLHVLAHPEARSALSAAFLDIAHDPNKAPPDLIQYCMHVLRWGEVNDAISSWLETERSERVRHIFKKFIMSFDDNWYGASMHQRFS